MSNNESKSIGWIVKMSMLLVAYLAWGFMAGSYAGSEGGADGYIGRGRIGAAAKVISSIYSFVITSITQLPKFFTVIGWHFSNRIWLPILFIVLEIGVIAGGYGLKRLEDSLEGSRNRKRR